VKPDEDTLMGMLLGLLLVFVIALVILLGVSLGLGLLLHWLLPAVGLDMALLIAVIAVGQTMLIFGRLINLPAPSEEPEGESEPRPIVILDPEVAFPPRRRRKRP
jgi:hypothetical protein